jgi:large subunit ribosomal protein L9
MKVILIDEIRGLGTRGDVVNVKDGYARNYLLPKNLAREATAGNLKSVEQERKKWALLAQKEKEQAAKAAESVKGTKVTVHKRVGENGQLFGSVTANEIADALTAKGLEVDKRRIELTHPIKSLGTHDVEVRLYRDVSAQIQVEVVPIGVEKLEEAPAPATEQAPQQ